MANDFIKRVYKSAGNNQYIIELDIDIQSARTNLIRKVFDKNYAKYRCDKALVVKIYNRFDEKEIDNIYSNHDNKFIYKKPKFI